MLTCHQPPPALPRSPAARRSLARCTPPALCALSGPNTDPSELRLLIPFRKPVNLAIPTPPHPPAATMRFVNVLCLSPAPPSTPARPSRPPLLPYFDAGRRLCAPALRRPTRSRRLHFAGYRIASREGAPLDLFLVSKAFFSFHYSIFPNLYTGVLRS